MIKMLREIKDPYVEKKLRRRSARRGLRRVKRKGPLHRTPYWYRRYLSSSWQHQRFRWLHHRKVRVFGSLIITIIILLIILITVSGQQ